MFFELIPMFVYGGEQLFQWKQTSTFASVVSFYDEDGTSATDLKCFFEQPENQYKLLDYCDSSTHIYELVEHFINKTRPLDSEFYWLLTHMKSGADFTPLPTDDDDDGVSLFSDDDDSESESAFPITIDIPEADMQITAPYYILKQLKTIIEFGIFTYVEKNKEIMGFELRRSLETKHDFIDALFI